VARTCDRVYTAAAAWHAPRRETDRCSSAVDSRGGPVADDAAPLAVVRAAKAALAAMRTTRATSAAMAYWSKCGRWSLLRSRSRAVGAFVEPRASAEETFASRAIERPSAVAVACDASGQRPATRPLLLLLLLWLLSELQAAW
jgi:hypothetical protein